MNGLRRVVAIALLGGMAAIVLPSAFGQGEITRKVKTKVAPEYPELARRMNIVGVVKIQVTVAANGSVKNAKVIGGHPLLADTALEAVKQWRYEPATGETTGLVEFHFDRH
jgi:protein TonB